MTSRRDKKIQKQKKREIANKKKIIILRENKQIRERGIKESILRERALKKLDKLEERILSKIPEDTIKQVEHNVKILKALEEEYMNELSEKNERNHQLEEMGYDTPEKKMKYLQNLALEEARKRQLNAGGGSMGGSAEYSCQPAETPKN